MNKIKVVCTVGDDCNYIAGKIYEADSVSNFWGYLFYSFDGAISINANFITLSEWRDNQINSILNDTSD
jgi:hypothetical protein